MKKLSILFTFVLFSLSYVIAQPTPPTPPSPSSKSTRSSSTKININIDDDQKLRLRANDHDIDMDMDFENINTFDIRKILKKHLGQPTSSNRGTDTWIGENKSYRVKLKKGNLEASFDKDELSAGELKELLDFAKDVFDELNWDVDVDGL